ncbi:hypothetical protein [Bergeyella zoohelcum]|uniref:Uncharacterized protein n=2 Tax=Bergeyella zoohelcum ATCC 43767 TaxID=883096 RepID=K1MNV4_9FLAO|nr:hypothetical protein [Bergeyella zoohelcum]EKB57849.1 hypothetical protein HMPREF9699_00834 [Bergeyella zoohelcum ATCC 43767]SUV48980.1 Uncharacterised protein [Bergeyella zoohelcum]
MNKTTIKISVLAFLGFMTYGYAQQQQQDPYKGKVGINTVTPSATMDVQPNSDNARVEAKTNEGIIAPKLSKTRIANIATPVEGTLVYATDATYTAGSDATVNNRVAKITEKGYYFYNGTEWVKAGSEVTQQIWQKQANKDILLVDNDIQNTVKYTENGGLVNTPKVQRPISTWNSAANTIESFTDVNTSNIGNSGNLNIQYVDKVPQNYVDPTYKEKQMNYNLFVVDGNSNTSPFNRFLLNVNKLQTNESLTKDIQSLYSAVNNAEHYGSGRVSFAVMGVYNNAGINNGSASRIVGSYNQASTRTSSDISNMEGTFSFVTPRGTGKIAVANGTRNHLNITNASTNTITHAALTRNIGEVTANFTGTIENLIGTHSDFRIHSSVTGIKNMYGLKIDNVNKGTQINRAIHTEEGQIRFGDLKGTGDRVVVADQNGVLKTSQFVMKATDTTSDCTASNEGAIHYKTIMKNGKQVGVFGFCTRNANGNLIWAYSVGGNNMLDGTGAFGSGL